MAEAFFNKFSKNHKAISAGTNAAHHMSDIIIDLMKEEGIDISNQRPKQLKSEMVEKASRIIALGDTVKKSGFLQVKMAENWHIPDPIFCKTKDDVRKIRDMIKERVLNLVKELDKKG